MLVVVTIIALLVALLLPAMKRVRLAMDRTMCATHQRQVQAAFLGFATDRAGKLPDMASVVTSGRHMLWCWPNAIADTLRYDYAGGSWEVMTCPADKYADEKLFLYQPPTFSAVSGAGQFRITSFSATTTSWLTPGGSGGSFDTLGNNYALLRVQDGQASTPLLMDTTYRIPASDVSGVWAWRWNLEPHSYHPYYGFHPGELGQSGGRNLAGINVAMIDGAVRWCDFDELQLRVYNKGTAPYRQYWW
ncbi:MAG: hypothetical protein GC162_03040 [Planctomycetes bacterium]|nr:hypothetical protein [Planctomycetota bacterium]